MNEYADYEIQTNTHECKVDGIGPYMEIMQIELNWRTPGSVELSFLEPSRNEGEEGMTGHSMDATVPSQAMDKLALAWLIHRGYRITAVQPGGEISYHSRTDPEWAIANLIANHQPPTP